MTQFTRRGVLIGGAAIAGASSLPLGFARPAFSQAKPKVVVIGGGPGGATLAKYLARDSNGGIDVTLVEPKESFTTCFHSNFLKKSIAYLLNQTRPTHLCARR